MTMTNETIVFIIYLEAVIEIIIPLILLIMVYKIYKEIKVSKNSIIKVMGKVEKRFNEYQLIANKIEIL